MTDQIVISVNDLELGELEEFESISGLPASSLANGISAKGMTALVYLSGKRADPAYTLEQARKVKLSDVKFENQADPTPSNDADAGDG